MSEVNLMCTVSKDFGREIHRCVNKKKTVAQEGVNESHNKISFR